ncbi:MAG: ComEC/Rec2 family competence protein, partial [bacterium]|nr:ComEC/Rec2 family competence protein [bacterium]
MKRLKSILQSRFVYCTLLFLSFCSYFICSNREYVSLYDDFSNEEFVITNIVLKDYGVKLELFGKEKVLGFLYADEERVSSFCEEYSIGDRVLISGDISDISNETVPNTFNYKKYLNSNGIYNVISITSIDKISDNSNVFYKFKNFLLERGNRLHKSSPYVNSLLFGNNSFIDEDVLSSYRENGISHLFAISGLHISIFVGIFGFILDKFKVKTVFKYIILIFFLLFYMFLTNFSMSVLRGCILTILLFVNKIFDFKIPTVNLLLLTLSIIMFYNSLFINNVGLKYSFLVTLFLIVFSDLINRGGKIYGLFMISLISFLCAYPITVNNFYQVNFLSILYNIFFVPFVSGIVIPFVFISYLFPFLDSILFFLIRILEISSQFLSSFSLFKVSMCKMNVLMISVYYVVLLMFFKKIKSRKIGFSFVIVLFFVVSFFMSFKSDDYVMFFDVGQGDSALISTGGSYTLIDTGGMVSFDEGEYSYKISKNKLLPYFKSVGIRKLDNLILTHGDADHMREADYLIKNFK